MKLLKEIPGGPLEGVLVETSERIAGKTLEGNPVGSTRCITGNTPGVIFEELLEELLEQITRENPGGIVR